MSDTKVTAPSLFTLTKITGRRRTEDRTIIIQSFEVNRRKFNVFLLGLIPTLPLTGIAALFIGAYSIVVPVLVMPLWFFLVDRRSPHGLQTATWQTIVDQRRSVAGKFLQCNQVLTDEDFEPYRVLEATVPVQRLSLEAEAAAILAGEDPVPLEPAPAVPNRRRASSRQARPAAPTASASASDYQLDDLL